MLFCHLQDEQHVDQSESSRKRKQLDDGNAAASSCSINIQVPEASQHEVTTIKCPAKRCDKTFPATPVTKCKMNLVRHVTAAHKPILHTSQLLEKINKLFDDHI